MNAIVRIFLAVLCAFPTAVDGGLETQWTQRFTGSSSIAYAVRVTKFDPAGNVIVAGMVTETGKNADLWVAKLSASTGQVLWDFRRNGSLNFSDPFGGIAIGPAGEVFVVGGLINQLDLTGSPTTDAFIAQLNPATGVPMWQTVTNPGPQAMGIWTAVALASDGNPVVTGLAPDGQQMGTDMRTAKFNAADGAVVWDRLYASFAAPIDDTGERIHIDSTGEIFVQGRHEAGSAAGVSYSPTAVVIRYGPDGTLRWGRRFREGQNLSTFAFLPAGPDGFVVGISTFNPTVGFTYNALARGLWSDGSLVLERTVPLVSAQPLMSVASNGDLLFAGRGTGSNGEIQMTAGRLSPVSLAPGWAKNEDSGSPGTGTGFGHVDLGTGETVVAGIAPRPFGDDLAIGRHDASGVVTEQLYIDGAAPNPPILDSLPNGPTLDSDGVGGLVVSIRSESSGSTRDVLVRRMRMAGVPAPVVTTGSAERTAPLAGIFHGVAEDLPFGGTAIFQFRLAGPGDPAGKPLTTVPIALPPSLAPQSVAAPFDLEPHRTYGYKLVVTATNGAQTSTGVGNEQFFTVPNAPLVSTKDVFFVPRGAIVGSPLANDFDGDPGEVLKITLSPTSELPGTFTVTSAGIAFKPARSFTGEIMVQYIVDDGFGSSATQQIVLRNALHYAGNYRALPPVTGSSAGSVDVTVLPTGRATAVMYLDGVRFPISGLLEQMTEDTVGFVVNIRRRDLPERTLKLSWTPDRAFTAELWEGEQILYRASGLRAGPSPFSSTNVYNLIGTHSNVSGNSAGRVKGTAMLRLPPEGKATFRGRLGDGTPFVTTARIQEDGRLPVYTSLQGRPASYLLGHLQPNAEDASTMAPGLLAVQGTITGKTPAYAADYRDLVDFVGPRFTPASRIEPPLVFTAAERQLDLLSSGGGFDSTAFTLPIWFGGKGQLSGIIGITRINIDGQTGEFSGAFLPNGQTRTVTFAGILQANANGGIAVFRGPPAAGQIQIAPQ